MPPARLYNLSRERYLKKSVHGSRKEGCGVEEGVTLGIFGDSIGVMAVVENEGKLKHSFCRADLRRIVEKLIFLRVPTKTRDSLECHLCFQLFFGNINIRKRR